MDIKCGKDILGTRYLLPKNFETRISFGKSFRTPTFEELYSRNIFDGHYFVGNENLTPEKSTSYEASIKKQTSFKNNVTLSNSLMVSFTDVSDRITQAYIGNQGATPMYEYINISKYNSINFSLTNQLKYGNWNFSSIRSSSPNPVFFVIIFIKLST